VLCVFRAQSTTLSDRSPCRRFLGLRRRVCSSSNSNSGRSQVALASPPTPVISPRSLHPGAQTRLCNPVAQSWISVPCSQGPTLIVLATFFLGSVTVFAMRVAWTYALTGLDPPTFRGEITRAAHEGLLAGKHSVRPGCAAARRRHSCESRCSRSSAAKIRAHDSGLGLVSRKKSPNVFGSRAHDLGRNASRRGNLILFSR
jgi:hypothetical protein